MKQNNETAVLRQTEATIDRLFVTTLLLAEITREKHGKGFSLTHPKIEKAARERFAGMIGIKANSKPNVFLMHIYHIMRMNGLHEKFQDTLSKFKMNARDFAPLYLDKKIAEETAKVMSANDKRMEFFAMSEDGGFRVYGRDRIG